MPTQNAFLALQERIKLDIPGFRIAYKDEKLGWADWKLWVANLFVSLFNKKFMTGYTTTLYPVVYFVSRQSVQENPLGAFLTLAHEYVHLHDERKRRLVFPISYLMPQILALLSLGALGAFWSWWFLLFLGFLAFLAPWRSPWRAKWEMRGYTMNMMTRFWQLGVVPASIKDFIVPRFVDLGAYYRMWPDEDAVVAEVERRASLIEAESFLESEEDTSPYEVCHFVWLSAQGK